jgi:hypothetical protein
LLRAGTSALAAGATGKGIGHRDGIGFFLLYQTGRADLRRNADAIGASLRATFVKVDQRYFPRHV